MFKDEHVAEQLCKSPSRKAKWKRLLSGCCALGSLLATGLPLAAQSGYPGYQGAPRFGAITQTQAHAPAPQGHPGAPPAFQPLPPAMPVDPANQPPVVADPHAGTHGAHPDVVSLPGIHSEVSVIQRRSQLIVTRSRIVQAAVADPSIIDIVQHSPTELSILGEGLGSTTLTIWFENNPEPLIYLVKTLRDPSLDDQLRIDYGKLEQHIATHFPNSKVHLYPVSGKIIVKGQARDSQEAAQILEIIRGEVINQRGGLYGPTTGIELSTAYANGRFNAADLASSNIINMLMIPGDFQVQLRVVIAELKRSELRQLATDIAVNINDGNAILSSALGGSPGSTMQAIINNGDVSVFINALHTNQTGKILAEPSVVTLSGHDATILAGGEFAVPTIVGLGGASAQQTVFRGFGTSMVVTPTIIDKDLIRMRIRPELSEVNDANTSNGIPGLNTRRVDTTVELREGQSIMLGGLFSNQSLTNNRRIPFLSSIPGIGPALFASKRSNQEETELLILVTPEIVRPLEADEVPPLPGHEVTVPDDRSLYLRGMTQGPNDSNVYQLAPYGHGSGVGIPVGHGQHNPAPSSPGYAPVPTYPGSAPGPGNFAPGGYGPGGQGPAYGPGPEGPEPYSNNRYGTPGSNAPRSARQPAPPKTGTSSRGYGPQAGRTDSAQPKTSRVARTISSLRRSNDSNRAQQVGYTRSNDEYAR